MGLDIGFERDSVRILNDGVRLDIDSKDLPCLIKMLVKAQEILNETSTNPRWHQENPQMQMVGILSSALGHAGNAKDGIIDPKVAIDRLTAHLEELLQLSVEMKGKTWWNPASEKP